MPQSSKPGSPIWLAERCDEYHKQAGAIVTKASMDDINSGKAARELQVCLMTWLLSSIHEYVRLTEQGSETPVENVVIPVNFKKAE